MKTTDKFGNQLLSVIQGDEAVLLAKVEYQPLGGALVIIKGPDGFMLLKNKYRKAWEVVGGGIDPGETARECALRECYEESGYKLATEDLRFVGIIECNLVAGYLNTGLDYAALYCADITTVQEFKENDEISAICWYKPGDVVKDANLIDLKLLEYFKWELD